MRGLLGFGVGVGKNGTLVLRARRMLTWLWCGAGRTVAGYPSNEVGISTGASIAFPWRRRWARACIEAFALHDDGAARIGCALTAWKAFRQQNGYVQNTKRQMRLTCRVRWGGRRRLRDAAPPRGDAGSGGDRG